MFAAVESMLGGLSRSLQTNDDTVVVEEQVDGLKFTLYLNAFVFVVLMCIFEASRNIESIYLSRMKKLQRLRRFPPKPSKWPLAWIWPTLQVSDEDFLDMVGLDGYVTIRYMRACFRVSLFFSVCGLLILVPIYATSDGNLPSWNKYTLANVKETNSGRLWVPVIFMYLFSAYFCRTMYLEYKHFMERRLEHLVEGDRDTPPQAFYTIMVESIPAELRSQPKLREFFSTLYPREVFAVELAMDIKGLEKLVAKRKAVRNKLEKAIAYEFAMQQRKLVWVGKSYYDGRENSPEPLNDGPWGDCCGRYNTYDAIEHYQNELNTLNKCIDVLQEEHNRNMQLTAHPDGNSLPWDHQAELASRLEIAGNKFIGYLSNQLQMHTQRADVESEIIIDDSNDKSKTVREEEQKENLLNKEALGDLRELAQEARRYSNGWVEGIQYNEDRPKGTSRKSGGRNIEQQFSMSALDDAGLNSSFSKASPMPLSGSSAEDDAAAKAVMVGEAAPSVALDSDDDNARIPSLHGVPRVAVDENDLGPIDEEAPLTKSPRFFCAPSGGLSPMNRMSEASKEAVSSAAVKAASEAQFAASGAFRGFIEAMRTLELLTLGAYERTSSTGFVTMKTRVARSSAFQMLLSHSHFTMKVTPAPNPKEIIWENVSIPLQQVKVRRAIANAIFIIGAIFWSVIVGAITAIANMDSLAQEYTWLQKYQDRLWFQLLNNYLAVGLLLLLLALLPILFNLAARSYEGTKLESEVQNSIMTRYFYYQVANVYVAVGLGSIANSIHEILQTPREILSILGTSIPSFSIYFTSLLMIKCFTAVPIEMMRLWPLIRYLFLKYCLSSKKTTKREILSAMLRDIPLLFGWIYPNALMVLMILSIYMCIAPFVTPFACIFFGFAYIMYKHQLLYVYINEYQSGGFMFYSLFDRSMISLLGGVCIMLAYYLIRQTDADDFSGAYFYTLLPLAVAIPLFWSRAHERFRTPSSGLSLEKAIEFDVKTASRLEAGKKVPQENFQTKLFRQPALAEGHLKPAKNLNFDWNYGVNADESAAGEEGEDEKDEEEGILLVSLDGTNRDVDGGAEKVERTLSLSGRERELEDEMMLMPPVDVEKLDLAGESTNEEDLMVYEILGESSRRRTTSVFPLWSRSRSTHSLSLATSSNPAAEVTVQGAGHRPGSAGYPPYPHGLLGHKHQNRGSSGKGTSGKGTSGKGMSGRNQSQSQGVRQPAEASPIVDPKHGACYYGATL